MTMTQTEHVLVVPTELFRSLGYFQGFCRSVDSYLEQLLNGMHSQFLPRSEMEANPEFKQLIPYCILRHIDEDGQTWLFQYTRGSGQGESRLHARRSIGVGGHISTLDSSQSENSDSNLSSLSTPSDTSIYLSGMKRELEEELIIATDYSERCVGLINDDENPVGQVHLGVVHLLDVNEPQIQPRELDIANAGFERLEDVLADIASFETWSQICLRALF